MPIQAKISEENNVAIVRIKGSIDSLSVDDLNYVFNDIKKTGLKNVLLVMKKVKFINSRAIGTIISFNRWTSTAGGVLKISQTPKKILETFRMVGLGELIDIYESTDDALMSFD